MSLVQELEARGLIDRITHEELRAELDKGGLTFYCGFDPTANSLHVGQLAMFNLMSLLQDHGHRPLGLMGGATGMIGDPGGKSQERNLLTKDQIHQNILGIQSQMERFLDFSAKPAAKLVNNASWLENWTFIDFLRDIGKHFSVNVMMTRDTVKSRLGAEGSGISYTEFSYMLLQAYDFYELYKLEGCRLQLGGSDQWGNIVSGIDLSRRMGATEQLFGLTMPLVTKKDGTKFGKSEGGAVWLSAEKTSPYAFYQYFLRVEDEDVIKFLKMLTKVPLAEIQELEASVAQEPHLRKAQRRLAQALTERVHGAEQLARVEQASRILFGEEISQLDDQSIAEIFAEVPSIQKERSQLAAGWPLVDALVETDACKSKGQARTLIQQGGAYINNKPVADVDAKLGLADLASKSFLVLRAGKKNYRLVEFQG